MSFFKNSTSSGRNYRNLDSIPHQTFKERNSFHERVAAVENIRTKFPLKVPVIVERYKKVNSGKVSINLQ